MNIYQKEWALSTIGQDLHVCIQNKCENSELQGQHEVYNFAPRLVMELFLILNVFW